MPDIADLLAALPPELQNDDEGDNTSDAADPSVAEPPADDESGDEGSDDTAEEAQDGDAASDDAAKDDTSDDSDDDYVVQAGEELKNAVDDTALNEPKAAQTNEGQYILEGLNKISVRIINAKDEVETVQVYGWGDLPRDYKGIATPYEQGLFSSAVQNQELTARQRQAEYRANQQQIQQEQFMQRENRAIAEDLADLRSDGLFPKFKGEPGSKEFNSSDGAKEFDRVINYMNEYNDRALEASSKGKAYRHIGFREAFIMLNGPNPKAAEQREQKARRAVASRTVTSQGTSSKTTRQLPRVSNITDLQSEWDQIAANS